MDSSLDPLSPTRGSWRAKPTRDVTTAKRLLPRHGYFVARGRQSPGRRRPFRQRIPGRRRLPRWSGRHAWAEVYFPEHGWFGCDPSLGEGTSEKHIVCGVSSHPRGVMPVSGYYSGSRRSYLAMDVRVDIRPFGTAKGSASGAQPSMRSDRQWIPERT